MSAAENLQREDFTIIETIVTIVEILDAELMEDKEYASLGKTPAHKVKALLDRLDSVRRSQQGGYEVSDTARGTSHKFVGRVQQIFKNLPNPLEWRSFYIPALPLIVDICAEIQFLQGFGFLATPSLPMPQSHISSRRIPL